MDAFRRVNPEAEEYTWWSFRGQAWVKDVGWRIDYQVVTPGLAKLATQTAIYKEERFSDHAPLSIDYDYAFDSPKPRKRAVADSKGARSPQASVKRPRSSQRKKKE